MHKNDTHFIVNPVAGGGKAHKLIPQIEHILKKHFSVSSSIHITEKQGEATQVVKEMLKLNNKVIVAVGGDGTVHESLNGFFNDKVPVNPSCELAIIKCGTGEDLSRSLNLPEHFDEQMQLLASPRFKTLDVGCVTYKDLNREKQHRYFLNECQAGVGGKVVKNVGQANKTLLGNMSFGMETLKQALFYKANRVTLQVDDQLPQERKLLGIVIGNGRFCGGGMQLTPFAEMNDGLFDILLIKEMRFFKRIKAFLKIYSGKHIYSDCFESMKGKKIKIDSDETVYIESDGELLGTSPCEIEIMNNRLKVKC